MNWHEVIDRNCKAHSQIHWWPRFAFHFTDVMNAVSILDKGFIFCRADAASYMANDNAAKRVIDLTKMSVQEYVRFYFRPLTPTQYYNEGYKHPQIQFQEANVPVPVFFIYDLAQMMEDPGFLFSEKTQAGHTEETLAQGIDAFEKLSFDQIYSYGVESAGESKRFRQAELLYPHRWPVKRSLYRIVCRNQLEKELFLQLLREKNQEAASCYRSCITVFDEDLFYSNGLFMTDIQCSGDRLVLNFSDTWAKKEYMGTRMQWQGLPQLDPFPLVLLLTWKKGEHILEQKERLALFDYSWCALSFKGLPQIVEADALEIRVYIGPEKHIMGYKRFMLKETAPV